MRNVVIMLSAFGILTLSQTINVYAVDTKTKPLTNPLTCSVRISNNEISKNSQRDGQLFCTGTLIDASTLVTAAHCLSEVSTTKIVSAQQGLTNQKVGIFVAVNNAATASQPQFIATGVQAIFTGATLDSDKQRGQFIQTSNMNEIVSHITDDLAVVHFAKPIDLPGNLTCPRLPSAADCAKFSSDLAAAPDNVSLKSYYYKSPPLTDPMHPNARAFYPTNSIVGARANGVPSFRPSTSDSDKKFVEVKFLGTGDDSSPIIPQRGDSGTSLIWSSGNDEIIVGVQSTSMKYKGQSESVAAFSQTCAHLPGSRWAAVTSHTNWVSPSNNPPTEESTLLK